MNDNTQADLAAIRQGRILFGHQSVGENVLQGVGELVVSSGVQGPRVVQLQDPRALADPFLAEVRIGKNGDPASKCAGFLRAALSFPKDGLDVAAMKLCYADFDPGTNVFELFQLYRRTVDSLRTASPQLVIVHCTAPLTARTPLWKRFAKWLLRRDDFSDAGNAMRKEYNELILQHYSKEPIFDIAARESTLPNGERSAFEFNGKMVYRLADEYTDDGGHLNQLGRKVASEEFVRVLAEALALRHQSTVATPQPVNGGR